MTSLSLRQLNLTTKEEEISWPISRMCDNTHTQKRGASFLIFFFPNIGRIFTLFLASFVIVGHSFFPLMEPNKAMEEAKLHNETMENLSLKPRLRFFSFFENVCVLCLCGWCVRRGEQSRVEITYKRFFCLIL